MPDWTKSMEQSYEYYTVEPSTMADLKRLDLVKKASFKRDSGSETLATATIDVTESIGETYVRGYLKTIQNGVVEKFPLGTVLVQTPSSSFDGKVTNVSMDAYSPLIELKEKQPPLGYTIRKGTPIIKAAYNIVRDKARAPIDMAEPPDEDEDAQTLQYDFVANTNDTWLTFVIDLLANAEYELDLGENGHILFAPKQDVSSLQPVWTYDDGNSSILHPEITMDHDLYGIPNVVEVIYSHGKDYKHVIVKNEDINSVTSTINRGREIVYRDTEPSISGYATEDQITAYAERLLRALSTIEYTVTYTHAYCPVRVGDCVRLDYAKAGLNGVKAKVISQNIKCEPGCPVTEKAVFTNKLWG